jgi:ubiquinone/menaquinone biosynthesis C-methylase UbiE
MTGEAKPGSGHRWHAAFYDRLVAGDKRMAGLRDVVVGGAAGKVLEIGCGTGLDFDHVNWENVESYLATDPDVFMLQRARARASQLPPEAQSRLEVQEAPAEDLPCEDARFDTVIASLVYCTVSDLDGALAETRRVLKPGGQLRLIEHVAGHGFAGMMQRVVQPVYGWMAADCQLRRDTETAVRSAGFELEVSQRFSLGPLWPGFAGIATKPA